MAMRLSLTNIFQVISVLSPLIITFFLIMNSIFYSNIKALIFIIGAIISLFINVLLMNIFQVPVYNDQSPVCKLIEFPYFDNYFSKYNTPSMNSMFIAFTFNYIYLPMVSEKRMNYAFFAFLFILFGVDAITQSNNRCANGAGILLGGIIGLLLGYAWYTIVSTTNKKLVYTTLSDEKPLTYKTRKIKQEKVFGFM